MDTSKSPRNSTSLRAGMSVDIIQKQDQQSGKRTRGVVQDILTNSLTHPHGIKVRLTDGKVGRVVEIFPPSNTGKQD